MRTEIIGVVSMALCLCDEQSPWHAGGREFESRRTENSHVVIFSTIKNPQKICIHFAYTFSGGQHQ